MFFKELVRLCRVQQKNLLPPPPDFLAYLSRPLDGSAHGNTSQKKWPFLNGPQSCVPFKEIQTPPPSFQHPSKHRNATFKRDWVTHNLATASLTSLPKSKTDHAIIIGRWEPEHNPMHFSEPPQLVKIWENWDSVTLNLTILTFNGRIEPKKYHVFLKILLQIDDKILCPLAYHLEKWFCNPYFINV